MYADLTIDRQFEKNGIYLHFCSNTQCGKRGTLVNVALDSSRPGSKACHSGGFGEYLLHITFKQSKQNIKKSFYCNTTHGNTDILSYIRNDGLCICDKTQAIKPKKTTISNITLCHNRTLRSPLESDAPMLRDDYNPGEEIDVNAITPGYSKEHPPPIHYKSTFGKVRNRAAPHKGWDFSYLNGTPVYALADGIVTVCQSDDVGVAGRIVRIQFTHSDGTKYHAHYCHLEDVLVNYNQCVQAGALIGHMGKSGTSAHNLKHPHLHLSIMNASPTSINPEILFGDWKKYVPKWCLMHPGS